MFNIIQLLTLDIDWYHDWSTNPVKFLQILKSKLHKSKRQNKQNDVNNFYSEYETFSIFKHVARTSILSIRHYLKLKLIVTLLQFFTVGGGKGPTWAINIICLHVFMCLLTDTFWLLLKFDRMLLNSSSWNSHTARFSTRLSNWESDNGFSSRFQKYLLDPLQYHKSSLPLVP